jgi:hypothetical protein
LSALSEIPEMAVVSSKPEVSVVQTVLFKTQPKLPHMGTSHARNVEANNNIEFLLPYLFVAAGTLL